VAEPGCEEEEKDRTHGILVTAVGHRTKGFDGGEISSSLAYG
jgi:hypothetical protein